MPTPHPDQLDQATINLVFALRDSLTDDGPSRLDFWGGRAATAIETAAAGADNANQAITVAARKLQIPVLTTHAAQVAKTAAEVINQDYQSWAAHVDDTIVYIMALATLENRSRKAKKEAEEEIPY